MSARPKVLCTVPWLPEEAERILADAVDVDRPKADRRTLLSIIDRYEAFWCHFDQKADKELLDRAERLKVINTASTGTDHIDKAEAARRGIRVLCIAKDLALLDTFTATAECAWWLLISCCRHMRAAGRAAHAGHWRRGSEVYRGMQLSRHTLGVLGVGRLGKMVVEFAKAFRMRVIGCDLRPFDIPGVEQVDFETLLRQSDAITIHIHMTPDNYHLIDAEALAKMKDGAILINTSRGDIIDETALLAALESGRLGAFGADVLHDEWRADMTAQPVVRYAAKHDNVVLTPHIGGATIDSVVASRIFSARKLVYYLRTGEELTMA